MSNITEIIKRIKISDKKLKFLILIGFIGILLILLSEMLPASSDKKQAESFSYEKYEQTLEEKCEGLIESIDGAGECRVMLTLKQSNESVWAKNLEESRNEGNYSNSYEYVLYKGQNGETPILLKEYLPQVKGVAVVCAGADDIRVKENIISSLSSVLDIPSSKISVSKLRG